MPQHSATVMSLYSGWDGYQRSMVAAIASLSREHLTCRLAPGAPSVGEIAVHIAFGRIAWFARMGVPDAEKLLADAAPLWTPWDTIDHAIEEDAGVIVHWLNAGWTMIEATLNAWTVDDLAVTFRQHYNGKLRDTPRQWAVWRVMAHDIHHGGQITMLLAAQGIFPADLGDEGGHIIEPPEVQ